MSALICSVIITRVTSTDGVDAPMHFYDRLYLVIWSRGDIQHTNSVNEPLYNTGMYGQNEDNGKGAVLCADICAECSSVMMAGSHP